jgi:hypothetical protein
MSYVVQFPYPQDSTVSANLNSGRSNLYPQAVLPSFIILAVRTRLRATYSIGVAVRLFLLMLGCKILILNTLDLAGCLYLHTPEIVEPCSSGVDGTQVEFFSIRNIYGGVLTSSQ